ncbi:hypothetical protein EB061_08440 [bacterium]|jgi:hypothetical protein|nr:hypothetical protein [bacterium]
MGSLEPVFSGIKSVLVVLSSKAMTLDSSALRNLINHSYPGVAVFFVSVSGDPVGVPAPHKIDLVIDFTEPKARQSLWFPRRMRSRGRFVVGRKTGLRGAFGYDRVYDVSVDPAVPRDYLDAERWAQRKVLELAGVPMIRHGGVTEDLSKEIARNLPPLQGR